MAFVRQADGTLLTDSSSWETLENGELLKAAEAAGFDVLLTPDKNIRYQQNLTLRTIALVVLGNPQWPVLRLHVSVSSLPSTRRDRAVTRKSKYLNFNRRYSDASSFQFLPALKSIT